MSPTLRILIGLILGLGLGIALAAAQPAWQADTVAVLDALGGVWLDALRMTIVPLVFALLVTGVAQAAGTLAAGGIAGRTLLAFAVLLVACLAMPSNWTQDVPRRYGARHPGLEHSRLYPALDWAPPQ